MIGTLTLNDTRDSPKTSLGHTWPTDNRSILGEAADFHQAARTKQAITSPQEDAAAWCIGCSCRASTIEPSDVAVPIVDPCPHKHHKQDFTARGRLDPKVPCQVWQLDKGSTWIHFLFLSELWAVTSSQGQSEPDSWAYPKYIPIISPLLLVLYGFIPPCFIIFPHPTPGSQVVALLLIARHGLHHLQVTGPR